MNFTRISKPAHDRSWEQRSVQKVFVSTSLMKLLCLVKVTNKFHHIKSNGKLSVLFYPNSSYSYCSPCFQCYLHCPMSPLNNRVFLLKHKSDSISLLKTFQRPPRSRRSQSGALTMVFFKALRFLPWVSFWPQLPHLWSSLACSKHTDLYRSLGLPSMHWPQGFAHVIFCYFFFPSEPIWLTP